MKAQPHTVKLGENTVIVGEMVQCLCLARTGVLVLN